MTLIPTDSILRFNATACEAFNVLNNAGCGFDPGTEIEAWSLVRRADHTSDVAVYTHTDQAGDEWVYLVGTDGSGSDNSRWAVRVGAVGVEY